jgi:exodeoxyribonuclease VII large subunit
MLEILLRRWPSLEVWVCPVRVQGDGAAEEIAAAVDMLNQMWGVDALIVGRGGGSTQDLAAFNEECVAHAIFRSRIPVVSAVGHEVDVTIADQVADCRALTPSEAAEIVTPNREDLLRALNDLRGRLRNRIAGRVKTVRDKLDGLADRRVFRLPLDGLREREQQLDELSQRLGRAKTQWLQRLRDRLAAQAAQLETLSPLNVLARGYSLTRNAVDGSVVRSAAQVQAGDLLRTRLQHGEIRSRVEG